MLKPPVTLTPKHMVPKVTLPPSWRVCPLCVKHYVGGHGPHWRYCRSIEVVEFV